MRMASTNQELAGASGCFPAFRFDSSAAGPSLMSVVNTFTTIRKARIWTAIVLETGNGKHMLDVYPGMKETQYDAFIVKRRGIHGHYHPITMREAVPLTISCRRPPRRSMRQSDGGMVGVIEIVVNMSGVRRLQSRW